MTDPDISEMNPPEYQDRCRAVHQDLELQCVRPEHGNQFHHVWDSDDMPHWWNAEVPVDVYNRQAVGTNADDIVVLAPTTRMTRQEALIHAAWLVALASDGDEEFAAFLKAVRNT